MGCLNFFYNRFINFNFRGFENIEKFPFISYTFDTLEMNSSNNSWFRISNEYC